MTDYKALGEEIAKRMASTLPICDAYLEAAIEHMNKTPNGRSGAMRDVPDNEYIEFRRCSNCEGESKVTRWGLYGHEVPASRVKRYPHDTPEVPTENDGRPYRCDDCNGTGRRGYSDTFNGYVDGKRRPIRRHDEKRYL